jgi:hypothetical protein
LKGIKKLEFKQDISLRILFKDFATPQKPPLKTLESWFIHVGSPKSPLSLKPVKKPSHLIL